MGNKVEKSSHLESVRQGEASSLETFWKAREIAKVLDPNPDIKIFLDSGAHSLLNAKAGLINSSGIVKATKKIQRHSDANFTAEQFDALPIEEKAALAEIGRAHV